MNWRPEKKSLLYEPPSFYTSIFICCSLIPQTFERLHPVAFLCTLLSTIVLRWITLLSFGLQWGYLEHQACPQLMSVAPSTNLQRSMLSLHKSDKRKINRRENSIKLFKCKLLFEPTMIPWSTCNSDNQKKHWHYRCMKYTLQAHVTEKQVNEKNYMIITQGDI